MSLLGFQTLGQPGFNPGSFLFVDDMLASRGVGLAGHFFERRRFIRRLAVFEILYGAAQVRLGGAIFKSVSLRGLHSLGRRFVCRQLNLLSNIQKTNITPQ
jgi:hypothetical protein